MKTFGVPSWRFLVGAVALVVGGMAAAAEKSAEAPLRYEAEQQTLLDDAATVSDSLASGGAAVQFGEKGAVQWRVTLPAAGRYQLWLRYRAASGEKAALLSVNDRTLGIGLPFTGGEWAEFAVTRTFHAGENSIVLRQDWKGLEIDYLRFDFLGRATIAPETEWPVITPQRNRRYADHAGELAYKVERNGHALERVQIDGHDVPFAVHELDYLDDAATVVLPAPHLAVGEHTVGFLFPHGVTATSELTIGATVATTPWEIITFDVNHGTGVFMRLPNGQTLLLDTAKPEEADRVILPFLKQKHLDRIDYVFITHHHEDHDGGLPAVSKAVAIGREADYRDFTTGEQFDLGGLDVTVLNSYADGTEENTRSLALRFAYRGFVYIHGADNYAQNQRQQHVLFPPEVLRAQVYHANHHFHGSSDIAFLRAVDPELVLVSAEQAVYARGTFTTLFRHGVEDYLRATHRRYREALLTHDVGHIIVRITDADHWTCETVSRLEDVVP